MKETELRFRQIHLDFHTSEHIDSVGSAFNPDEFGDALLKAKVNSITCFARCHHGWIYFDSKKFPERRHPHLKTDLLPRQIEAAHRRGIRVPIYLTIQWDYYSATRHPEWVCIEPNGALMGTPPLEAGFYQHLCVNSPYREFLRDFTTEVLETLPTDGFFFDIVWPVECVCRYCREQMLAEKLDPGNPQDREAFGRSTINRFKDEMSHLVRQKNSDCSIFYNAGHIGPRHRAIKSAYSHFEIESLPGGEWGYIHFPVTVRYARTLGLDYLGHTGKFHTSWGDFHSFKNLAALRYECLRMLAHGAKCLIGDQLPPNGKIDAHVYQLVGAVYAEVEQKEPWCREARPVTEIGVLTPEEFTGGDLRDLPSAIRGATRILEQGAHQFDVIDSAADFTRYRLLLLPDNIPVSSTLAAKLKEHAKNGGSILASFASGMNGQQMAFTTDLFGVSLAGEGPRDLSGQLVRGKAYDRHDYCEYLVPRGEIGRGLPATEHAMYRRGMSINADATAELLAPIFASYFDRTYRHFCSHRQTPSSGSGTQPGIVRKDRCIYFSSPIFSQYDDNAPRWCKLLVLNAVELLLPEALVKHDGPSTLLTTVTEQPNHGRWIVHLLHFVPERRSKDLDVIEDVIPLFNLNVSVRTPRPVSQVLLVPEDVPLAFEHRASYTSFQVPKVDGHAMLSLTL
ncbi:MAG: beta-galactosidase trimerization domain-containing protein [Verrucomicrobia bacterium]|nr:beta-galactosidase trimerization domain-containing protein [Verrucomicrobiota bacterium]